MTAEQGETRGEPSGGSQRRSRLVEAVLACATVLALCTVVLAAPSQAATPGAFLAAVGFGMLAILGGVLPRTALCLTILGIFAYYAMGLPPLGMVLPAVGALYLTAAGRRTAWAVGGAVVLLGVATYFRLADGDPAARFTGYEYVTELALAAASIALGVAVRFARQAQQQAEQIAELVSAEQEHLAERRLAEERLRISRELHDTVGHQLTVTALHASVAAEELEAEQASPAARQAVERVRAAGVDTLRELRSAVRTLRDGTLEPGHSAQDESEARGSNTARDGFAETPKPGFVAPVPDASVLSAAEVRMSAATDPIAFAVPDRLRVSTLARTMREAGLRVETAVDVPTELPETASRAAAGILTEAVTNVLRHAAADAVRVEVSVSDASREVDAALHVSVSDNGVGCAPAALDNGHGIRGMRERVALVGGTLLVETSQGHGCAVRAELPLTGSALSSVGNEGAER